MGASYSYAIIREENRSGKECPFYWLRAGETGNTIYVLNLCFLPIWGDNPRYPTYVSRTYVAYAYDLVRSLSG